MRIFILVLSVLASLLWSVTALSHHAFSAEFDVARPLELTGIVEVIEWTNPHAWVFIESENDQGVIEGWAVELLGVSTLMRGGMTPDNFKPGDLIAVTGFGSRDGTNTLNASSVINVETGEVLWAAQGRN
jgi:hypothetical protein